MYRNTLSRFMILMGLTLALPLSIVTSPVLAQTINQPLCPIIDPLPGVTAYRFPVTLPNGNQTSIEYSTGGFFCYEGQTFTGNRISIVNSPIGKQVTVNISGPLLIAQETFTLLLPNDNPPILNGPITAVGITIDKTVAVIPPSSTTTYELLKGTAITGS